ncbi:transmembrane secretion effector [Labedella gwakjiensis]|uniref:MFS transporter n=1 Tax=Labedella gwakjiensis TaxID=390269 RepID=A0A2P8GV43_9MICO|nr:MFS transporter [Labedella gwakjiensis]PSL37840.1 transmembrane secretion effector [Labedella gwakjiensis]RUQ87588.1 MFS transporter [Labedella gwakjiensis]
MRERKAGLGPAFGNLFTSNLASSLGDGIARTAAPLLAVRLTDDPLLVSGIAALAMLPWLLFAVPAGIIIDRIDRRTALALANGGRAVLAGGLVALAATDSLTIWWLYAVIFLYGIGETIYDGAIRAVVPSIVNRSNLPRANSRIEAGELVVQNFLSGPFTSALFAVSVLIPLGANALVYAGAVVLAILLPRAAAGTHLQAAAASGTRVAWHRQFADGFRFILASRMLTTLLALSTFIGLCYSAATASFVLYLLDRLALPEALFGVFMLTGAIGGIIGSMIAQRLKDRWGAGTAMAVANVVSTASFLFIGLVPTLWAAGVGYFISSAAVLVWNVHVMSLRQSVIPSRLLGRVHGSWRTVLWGTMPLGSLIGGALGRIDLTVPFIVGGGVATVAALVFFRFLRSLPNPEDVDNGDPRTGSIPTVS